MRDIREDLSKSSKVDINEIFVDSSNTSSIPLSPSKKESKSIILLEVDNNKTKSERNTNFRYPACFGDVRVYENFKGLYASKKSKES